jgi:chemotaxis protein histidine kinase CheA
MLIVIAMIVLAALVFGIVRLAGKRRTRDPATAAQRAELKAARRDLRKAQKARNDAIKTAQRSLKSAESAYERRVRQARATLAQLVDPDGKKLGSYAGITLYEMGIRTPNGGGPLIGASATVDTAGNLAVSKRPTLTRMAAGGLLLGPFGALGSLAFQKTNKHDSRELYLLVETTELSSVVKCPADDGLKARSFAAKINTVAKQAPEIAAARPQQVEAARKAVAAAESETGAVQSARAELARVEADPALADSVAVAQARLGVLEGRSTAGPLALPAGEGCDDSDEES